MRLQHPTHSDFDSLPKGDGDLDFYGVKLSRPYTMDRLMSGLAIWHLLQEYFPEDDWCIKKTTILFNSEQNALSFKRLLSETVLTDDNVFGTASGNEKVALAYDIPINRLFTKLDLSPQGVPRYVSAEISDFGYKVWKLLKNAITGAYFYSYEYGKFFFEKEEDLTMLTMLMADIDLTKLPQGNVVSLSTKVGAQNTSDDHTGGISVQQIKDDLLDKLHITDSWEDQMRRVPYYPSYPRTRLRY